MARIRNIKPDFFRHEALQDLENEHPQCYIMLTYVALWTQCDASGIFPWKPRTLKLDILPFLEFSLENTLQILLQAGYLQQYTDDSTGEKYGLIPTFGKHQRLTGKEATEGDKYPKPQQSAQGNNRETTGKHPDAQGEERREGKEIREREGNNARAHEAQSKSEKNSPTSPGSEKPLPDQLRAQIEAWVDIDENFKSLVEWKKTAGYSDKTHGPTTSELIKFVGYYLGRSDQVARFTEKPILFFIEQFPAWLARATEYNTKSRKSNARDPPRYTPPPYKQQTAPPRTGPTTLSDTLKTTIP